MKISDTLTVLLPEGYEPTELPYFNEWLNALESGKYTQGTDTLYSNDRYCCLGILSKIQGRLTEFEGKYRDLGENLSNVTINYLSSDNPLFGDDGRFPDNVRVWMSGQFVGSLAALNDREIPFEDIAKAIRHIWKPAP